MSSTSLGGEESAGARHRAIPGTKVALRDSASVQASTVTDVPPATGAAVSSPPATTSAAPEAAAGEVSIGQLVQTATQDVSTLLRGEIALAKLELQSSIKRGGVGAALFVVAGALALYAVTFGLIAFGEGLVAAGIWRWAAYLIVMIALLVVAGILGFVGFVLIRRVQAPKRAIASTKETVDTLRGKSVSLKKST